MTESAPPRRKAPWSHRMAIGFFTVLLGFLVFWLLGFIVDDIETLEGPDYEAIEDRFVDEALEQRRETVVETIARIERDIGEQRQRRSALSQSTQSLQKTIGQLIELQKLQTEKEVALSEVQQKNFDDSMNLFLANQEKDQEITQELARLEEEKISRQNALREVEEELQRQREPAREEYRRLSERHELRKAFLQLAFLVPLLLAAGALVVFKRGAPLFPVYLAVGCATLVKAVLVIHRHFPTRYFKYILLVVFILVVIRVLVYFIRAVRSPRLDALVKQYRQAYERFLCPVCEYPIRRGPMRFLFWTRRSVKKLRLPAGATGADEPYTCPSCSSPLYERCPECEGIRTSLLPYCEHCGTRHEIQGEPD